MSQQGEIEKVKSRIRALASKTVDNGCTEAEVLSAAEMIGVLLDRYCLTMNEVDVRSEACVTLRMGTSGIRRRPVDHAVSAIARFCGCIHWIEPSQNGSRHCFFGMEPDTLMAGYLYNVVRRAVEAFPQTHAQGRQGVQLRNARRAFQWGMTATIMERLNRMYTQRREAAVAASGENRQALVLLKDQIVAAAFAEEGLVLTSRKVKASKIKDARAYWAGRSAGKQIDLNRPLGPATQTRTLALA